MAFETANWMLRERELPHYYFSQFLYRRGADPSRFVGRKRCTAIRSNFFHRGIEPAIAYLEDKNLFWLHMRKTGLPVAEVLAYTLAGILFDARHKTSTRIDHLDTLQRAIRGLGEAAECCQIFAKPSWGLLGRACILFEDGHPLNCSPEKALDLLTKYPYVFQARVCQHPDISAVYPKALNTIRLNTITTDAGAVVCTPFAKFGAGGAMVDNGGAGGVLLPLDLHSGKACGPAFRLFKQGGQRFDHHPDTGYAFADFEVPHYDEASSLVVEAARWFPQRFVGWDVAITEAGPLIIEGNTAPNLPVLQLLEGGFRGNKTYERMLASIH